MKYIRHDSLGFVIWNSIGGKPSHKDMADFVLQAHGGELLSAGFVLKMGNELNCFGDSASLDMLAARSDDAEALQRQLEVI